MFEVAEQVKGGAMSAGVVKSGQERLGFAWWTFQGWASLIVGTLICLSQFKDLGGFAVVLAAVSIGLSVMIIRFSKTAFVIGTVLSINPILWIINGIYIKNRWRDPRLLENQGNNEPQESHTQAAEESAGRVRVAGTVPVPATAVTPDAWPTHTVGQGSAELEALMPSDEGLWEKGMREAESPDRRQGLWAKCFGESNGVESAAKAAYMAARVTEMKAEIRAEQQKQEALRRAEEEERRLAHVDEAQRAYERLLKGTCPSCAAIIPVASADCPKCKALFGPNSAWSVKPVA